MLNSTTLVASHAVSPWQEKGEMDTAGRRSIQSHDPTRHIHRVKGCWSARGSTVVAFAHSLFVRSAPRRFDVRLFQSGIISALIRNTLPKLDDSTAIAFDGFGSFSLVRVGA